MKKTALVHGIGIAAAAVLTTHTAAWAAGPAGIVTPGAQSSRAGSQERGSDRERISRTLTVSPTGQFDLSTLSGDILVSGVGGDRINLVAVKRARRGGSLSEVELQVEQRGDRVEVRSRHERGSREATIDFEVQVPSTMQVTLKSVSGDIHVSNIAGELWAQTVSGDLHVETAGRLALAKSVSGDVTLSSVVAAPGEMSVGTVSGELGINGLESRTLSIETVSGSLQLTGIRSERLDVRSVSGDVFYTGDLAAGGRYTVQSHSGDIRIRLVNDIGFELRANTYSGHYQLDLPITVQGLNRGSSQRGPRNQSITGVYKDGSAILDITTFSGNVTIGR